jgi:hypothetical protein
LRSPTQSSDLLSHSPGFEPRQKRFLFAQVYKFISPQIPKFPNSILCRNGSFLLVRAGFRMLFATLGRSWKRVCFRGNFGVCGTLSRRRNRDKWPILTTNGFETGGLSLRGHRRLGRTNWRIWGFFWANFGRDLAMQIVPRPQSFSAPGGNSSKKGFRRLLASFETAEKRGGRSWKRVCFR